MDSKKTVSLNDILENDIAKKNEAIEEKVSRKKVDINDILPHQEEPSPKEEFESYHLDLIDKAIERTKKDMLDNVIGPFKDKCIEIAEREEIEGNIEPTTMGDIVNKSEPYSDKSLNDIPDKPKGVNTSISEIKADALDIDFDEKDFDDSNLESILDGSIDIDVDGEDADKEADKILSEEEQKAAFKDIQAKITEALNHSKADTFNINDYTISNNPVGIAKTMSRIANDTTYFSESQSVPLYNTGSTISFTPLTGPDIIRMGADGPVSQLELLKRTYSIMYSHVAGLDRNKISFNTWLKSIDAGDTLQLYFGLYKATFAGANYIGYKCEKCDNFFMAEKPMDEMWSFNPNATDKQKDRFNNIAKYGEITESESDFSRKEKFYKISNNYVVHLQSRSLYNTLEVEYLDKEFKDKYSSIIQPMQFIKDIFFIDSKRKRLIPIDMKPTEDSIVKTIRKKCIVIYKMFSTITPDEYSMFIGEVSNFNIREAEASNLIQYHVPEHTCVETYKEGAKQGQVCNTKIPKDIMSPYQLLFTRHQLALQSTLRVD